MDRRAALSLVASTMLGGCGGGGGGGADPAADSGGTPVGGGAPVVPAPAPPAPEPTPQQPQVRDIALWGDSLTPPVANNLRQLVPDRTIFDGGISGQTSSEIAARQLADAAASGHNTWINVFWYGHNNQRAPAQIEADIAASVAALAPGNDRFIVLALVNQATPNEIRGGRDYAAILQLNNDLAARYPQNYLDIRAHLVSRFDPANAQDVIDSQNDVVPSSLRFDEIHLNNNGSIIVAEELQRFVTAKGW